MSATYASVSNQVAALKELYTGDDYMQDLVYKKNPFLALVPKDESPSGFAGKYIPVPMIYGAPQGRSATFANAQSNQTAPSLASFFVYRVSNYAVASITNELLEATKDNAGAFIDEGKLVMDTAVRNISNDLAADLFRDGSGVRGQISVISTGVITLVNLADVVQFEVGMVLRSYNSSFAQATGNNPGYVIAVNRSSGQVTVSASAGGIAGTPTNWSSTFLNLVQDGDNPAAATATSTALKVSGLAAWLPTTAPSTGDSFWGVDRSVDPVRLAGVRYDGSAQSIEEALIDGAALVAREGGQPDMCFMNFASYSALEKSLGAKVQYVSVQHDTAEISFKGIQINAPYGPITIIPDRNCKAQTAYLLSLQNWKFRSLGKAPHILTYGMEGLDALRVSNADAVEIRWGYYGNLVSNAPGWSAVVQLSS
jgi:hypothetical protein